MLDERVDLARKPSRLQKLPLRLPHRALVPRAPPGVLLPRTERKLVPTETSTPPLPPPAPDPVEQLERLADLLDRGLLSRDEFEHKKRELLGF
jgi:hypothetical protein